MLMDNLCIKSRFELLLNIICGIFAENKDVFALFNCYSEALSYTPIILCKKSHSFKDVLQNIKLSSAHKKRKRKKEEVRNTGSADLNPM